MTKLKYTNNANGLTITFSTTDNIYHLVEFNGSSIATTAITYQPIATDGQQLISTNLQPRNMSIKASLLAIQDGKYNDKLRSQMILEIQRCFVAGQGGRLEWSDGTDKRFIDCRVLEGFNVTKTGTGKAEFEILLVADNPVWFDTVEQVYNITSEDRFIINNPSGFSVPVVYEVVGAADKDTEPWLFAITAGASLALFDPVPSGYTCVMDTAKCTVKLVDSKGKEEYANQLLSTNSEFFNLLPGDNEFWCPFVSGIEAKIKWRIGYLGVG